MTEDAVITRERTTAAEALARYRAKASIARRQYPVTPIAFYGRHEALEGEPAEGMASLSFPAMAAARGAGKFGARQGVHAHPRGS